MPEPCPITSEEASRLAAALRSGNAEAVRVAQARLGVTADGAAGPVTWGAFYEACPLLPAKAELFDAFRPIFGGKLTQGHVGGIEAIFTAAMAGLPTDPALVPMLSYVLATAKWETAHTMQPIREYGRGAGRPYGKPAGPYRLAYYGRGFVQLTWLANYQKATEEFDKLGLSRDFVRYPDAVMEPANAALILVLGMRDGWFTGKKLADYIKPRRSPDYVGARRIVNGTDRAREIAAIADAFEGAFRDAYAAGASPA